MKWLFYVLGVLGLLVCIGAFAGGVGIFHEMFAILAGIFGIICLGFGALLGRRK